MRFAAFWCALIALTVPAIAPGGAQVAPVARPTATPAYRAYGLTPDASGTACPGELDAGRSLAFPQRINVTPESVAYFHAHNTVADPAFIVTLRLDGVAAVVIPARLAIDDGLRAALIAFGRQVTIRPPIPQCARPAGIFVADVSLTTGTVTISVVPPPGPRPSASP